MSTEDIIERALERAHVVTTAEQISVATQDEGNADIYEVTDIPTLPDARKCFDALYDAFGQRLLGLQVRPGTQALDIYIESAPDDTGR